MCGIVGYIGTKEKRGILLSGLKELEYRGYDSAGIAVLKEGEICSFKATGKLSNLDSKTHHFTSEGYGLGIGHTRWATHGKPTEANAHPHWGAFSYVIHNGIIENYKEIKETYLANTTFLSQTDTEVIVHLFERFVNEGLNAFDAFEKTVEILHGAYAILLISQKEPDVIFFAKNAVPLIVGRSDEGEVFFGSSDAPLIGLAKEVNYLEDGHYGWAKRAELTLLKEKRPQTLHFKPLTHDKLLAQKDGYRYFMEKEIYEQTSVVAETLMGRIKENEIVLDELPSIDFSTIDAIKICACGTSYHAGLAASYLFERLSKIRCTVEIASEFRYKEPLLDPQTLFIVISQSGETADTLEALKMAQKSGMKTLAICNVDNSSIVRTADATLLTRAGIEKGVASTKAFATQMITLWLLSLYLGYKKNSLLPNTLQSEIDTLLHIPLILKVDESMHEKLHRLSKRYLHGHGFFFIGRDIFYPLALEGALKLKEISYLHAEGYPAGEMKHGPIALADSELFTIALMPKTLLYDKIKSNVQELSARDSTLLVISPEPFELSDDFIQTHTHAHPMAEFFEMMVITQLLALEISIRLGNDVDMPRNLAKSVTVE